MSQWGVSSAQAVELPSSTRQHDTSFSRHLDGTQQHDERRNGGKIDGSVPVLVDEDIPENMYRPDKDDPEGWIHRDKLAKIENEELQAAGINLANSRQRSYSKQKADRDALQDVENGGQSEHDEKRQRRQSLDQLGHQDQEENGDADRATWDIRTPEEIEAEAQAAQQMYSNPVLRKSGSKIPVLTGSPVPVPIGLYGRETLVARKRAASGTISFDGDRAVDKTGDATLSRTPEDTEDLGSIVASSNNSSPSKQRSPTTGVGFPTHRKTASTSRKISAPLRATPSPGIRPATRTGEHDRPRTALNRPEGDPPWLATMYKPDPMLPPDQQLIPTLAKKQRQAQWAEEKAVPKTYGREFETIEVHESREIPKSSRTSRTPSPVKVVPSEVPKEERRPARLEIPPPGPVHGVQTNNSRPGTAGSMTGGYSTMPKVSSPAIREGGFNGAIPSPGLQRPVNMSPPARMQAQNLTVEDGEKAKKGCGCCVVM